MRGLNHWAVPGFAFVCLLATAVNLAHVPPAVRGIEFADDFQSGSLNAWQFPYPEDWVIGNDGGIHFLHMLRSREPLVPRRPIQFALLKGVSVGSFTFQSQVRRQKRSVLMVFDYVDSLHFYYAHLSVDSGTKQPVHNGIFIVNGGARRRIAGLDAAPALPDQKWHRIRVRREASSGAIEVFVDDEIVPRFAVIDRTFICGQIGLGSFDETGDFADVRLTSFDAGCQNASGGVIHAASANLKIPMN